MLHILYCLATDLPQEAMTKLSSWKPLNNVSSELETLFKNMALIGTINY